MSSYPSRFISINDFTANEAKRIIEKVIRVKNSDSKSIRIPKDAAPIVVALVILEPSTRTRMNFEIAAHRIGANPVLFTADGQTSLVKGETEHETLENILAMRPDLVVVRHSGDPRVTQKIIESKIPVINAGDGKNEHPTQALLDAVTIFERRGQIAGERVLFVGDVEHSRVARSGRLLFEKLGAQVAVCAPEYLMPKSTDWSHVQQFSKLSEGLTWATVCMGLRVQKERHSIKSDSKQLLADYVAQFRIDLKNMTHLKPNALIMHPGPFVPDEDLSEEVLSDPRCVIHDQVTNGVFTRMVLLSEMLERGVQR
jgi:aspartate carbamoyltransferase catalytic subunit